ncbi:MAG: hypothetical protein HQL73_07310 [Magnetococcales bacterium]|nr:hypothetical protein [Magnetococcales bacterium]
MKKLGDLTLPSSMQWLDRHQWSPVAVETARTLGGGQVIWSLALSGGRPITLAAEATVTWLDRETVEAILAMAAQAGAVFTLRWGDDSCSVMFDQKDGQAASFQPTRPHGDRFIGTIKLIEV